MHVAARARLALARRPWIYWAVVAVIAILVAFAVNGRLADVDAARNEWGATRTVVVADRQIEPGDPVGGRLVDLPIAALPDDALTDIPPGARARQRAAEGEVLTILDVASSPGPAALAEPGTVVVGLTDPMSRGVSVALQVQVAADGLILTDAATVVDVVDDVIFVAVRPDDAPSVAAAAQQGIASLIYLP